MGKQSGKYLPLSWSVIGITLPCTVPLWRTFHEPIYFELALTVNSLSAYLYEATNQDQYHNAATLSAEFIKAHLYNGAIIIDSIALSDCAVVAEAVTYNSGFFIDGLSVYANYTNNSDWSTLCVIAHHFVARVLI